MLRYVRMFKHKWMVLDNFYRFGYKAWIIMLDNSMQHTVNTHPCSDRMVHSLSTNRLFETLSSLTIDVYIECIDDESTEESHKIFCGVEIIWTDTMPPSIRHTVWLIQVASVCVFFSSTGPITIFDGKSCTTFDIQLCIWTCAWILYFFFFCLRRNLCRDGVQRTDYDWIEQ